MLKKLSLAALIAMGSMSVASATPLTEAIKGVDLSGMIRVRFYNNAPKDQNSENRWRTSSDFKFTIPVSEELKVVYKLGVEGSTYADDDNANVAGTDPNPAENLVFLKYSANGVNVIAGKIPVATSVTGSGHGEAHGAGAIATFKASDNVTLAAAWVNAVKAVDNIAGGALGNDIYAVAALFNVDMVKGNVWYYHATNKIKNLYTVSVDVAPVENVDVHADYAAGKLDAANAKTMKYFNVSAKYTQDAVCAKIGYAKTSKDGDLVVLDMDAPISAVLPTDQKYSIATKNDTAAIYAKVGYNVDAKTNVYVAYSGINDKTVANNDYAEYVVGASYKYTKKMKFSALYSVLDGKNGASNNDNNELKLEAKYSF
ncbi:major outer membrane protein [Nautilia lithotrophica]